MASDQDALQLGRFRRLLADHKSRLPDGRALQRHHVKLVRLVEGFSQIYDRHREMGLAEAARCSARLPPMLDRFRIAFEGWRISQESTAEEFNLLDVLDVARDEVSHSKLLAWLLDRRIERNGTHAQGNLGFRLFLVELRRELKLSPECAEVPYWVRTELAGDKSRIDLEIAARGQFVIHIENKIHSAEGFDQTNREWADLTKRAELLAVPSNAVRGIFLTVTGGAAENANFVPISWDRVARVLDKFAAKAKPPDVKVFAAHCARVLYKFRAETVKEDRSPEYDQESI